MANEYPQNAWINNRESRQDSTQYGEVAVPQVNIWQNPGPLSKSGKIIGQISHGTQITVLSEHEEVLEHQKYFEVVSGEIRGWIIESCIAWKWSCFTFLGTLSPAESCKILDAQFQFCGMNLMVKGNGFAVVTEGDPGDFESIYFASSQFINRMASSQTPLTIVALKSELANWVEIPISADKDRTVGFLSTRKEQEQTISNEQISMAYSIVPLMAKVPYLDLALSDFSQALAYTQHATIFLARAIESIENYFNSMKQKGTGKEVTMQQLLGIKKSDVEYITKRANASHRRHASRDATVDNLPPDELAECFQKTANIISAFAIYLEKEKV